MFLYKSFLKLGDDTGESLDSLLKGGYELSKCNYSFSKEIDFKGQVQTAAKGGIIEICIPSFPADEMIAWAVNHRRLLDGMIIFCDAEGVCQEKIIFNKAACVSMEMSYIRTGNNYVNTSFVLSARKMSIGVVMHENNWVNH